MDNQHIDPSQKSQKTARPYWLPEEVVFDELPVSLQRAILIIINPAYKKYVLKAPLLQQTIGISIVPLLWIEILQESELAAKMVPRVRTGESTQSHQEAIARHLRLLGVKAQND